MNNTELIIRTSSQEEVHSNVFFEFVGHFGFSVSADLRRSILMAKHEFIDDSALPLLSFAIKGKLYSIEGNIMAAYNEFTKGHALALQQYNKDKAKLGEQLAYIKFEFAVFLKKIGEYVRAKETLLEAQSITESPLLSKLIKYQLLILCYKKEKIAEARESIEEYLDDFKSIGLLTTVIFGYQQLGVVARGLREYDKAMEYFNNALKLEIEIGYDYIRHIVTNSICQLYIAKKDFNQAIPTLQEICIEANSNYVKTYTLENISLAYFQMNETELAISNCQEALSISLDHQIVDRIPGQANFIGELYYKKLNEPRLAKFYYQTAFQHALKYSELGFAIKGARLQAINCYMDFIKSTGEQSSGESSAPNIFEFAIGKTWAELTDFFKFNLVIYHRKVNKSVDGIVHGLNLSRASFNGKQVLLKKRGFQLPNIRILKPVFDDPHINQEIQDYIGKLKDKSWEGALGTFEKEVMSFLYAHNNYNKRTLSNALDFSYSHTLLKMRELDIPSYRPSQD